MKQKHLALQLTEIITNKLELAKGDMVTLDARNEGIDVVVKFIVVEYEYESEKKINLPTFPAQAMRE